MGGRSDNTVKNVTISDSTVTNSANGVRIKTVADTTGSVDEIHYSNINLSNISEYGVVFEQDYKNGGPTGKPTTGVPITHLTANGIHGSVDKDATTVKVLCGDGSCSGWTWEGVDITGGKKGTCTGAPSGVTC